MNYLAVDTSGKNLSIIIKKDGVAYKYYDGECGVRHSVSLMPEIEKLVTKAQAKLSDLDFFAVVVGAGSFTGIRIGVSAVKAMCFAYNKPCLAITSFDTLAYNVNKVTPKTLAILDAGHGGYYACGYNGEEIDFAPTYILEEQLEKIKLNYQIVVTDKEMDGATAVATIDGLERAVDKKVNNVTFNLDSIEPLYCRKSQAEEGRK